MASAQDLTMSEFARRQYKNKYAHRLGSNGDSRKEEWPETAARVADAVLGAYLPNLVGPARERITQRQVMPGGRYLASAGMPFPQCNNCFLFRVDDSREGWADLEHDTCASLMTGGGIGVVYSDLRRENAPIARMGGFSTGPGALMNMTNEKGRFIMQGGSRRSAIWAGLHWWHPDVFKFIASKEWTDLVKYCKTQDFGFPAPMDMTNISVILDDDFFEAYQAGARGCGQQWRRSYKVGNEWHEVTGDWACDVYWASVRSMLRTGEPGFSVDVGENSGENLRNACTEVTSRTNQDMCNLLSLNMARIATAEEFRACLDLAVAFALCGSLMSKLPVPGMYRVREQNRRVGIGLMGVHEWLLQRGHRYGPCDELAEWMAIYARSGDLANLHADRLGISRPVATRSIAPTGTISIVAETTSGIEPITYVAYKRRYLDGRDWKAQCVVDPTAHRLVRDKGIDPALIEDSMTLAEDVERRMSFQAWLQRHVDHGISSTINLPPWGSSVNNESTVTRFGNLLLKYLPELRGITAYPDGSRGGQPITKMPYAEAIQHLGVEFLDNSEAGCKTGVCGG